MERAELMFDNLGKGTPGAAKALCAAIYGREGCRCRDSENHCAALEGAIVEILNAYTISLADAEAVANGTKRISKAAFRRNAQ